MVVLPNPVSKFKSVGDGCREHDHVDVVRQHDDDLLPDNATLSVVHIVHLIEDDPLDVADDVSPAVEHRAEDLRGEDEAGGLQG